MEIVVGVIGRPHGVRGEVAVELRTDEPERRFAPGQVLGEEGGTRRFTVRSVRDHSGRVLVRFAELVDRAGAGAAGACRAGAVACPPFCRPAVVLK